MKPTCSQATILNSCYLSPGAITPKQQKALKIYANMLELAIIGGTDYVGRLPLIVQDANALCCGMLDADRDAARIQIAFNQAAAAGANVPATLNAKQAQINCIVEWDDKQMDEVDLLLTCALGQHATQS